MELVGAVGDGKSDLGPQWSTSMNILQKLGHAARDLIAARASDQGQIVFLRCHFGAGLVLPWCRRQSIRLLPAAAQARAHSGRVQLQHVAPRQLWQQTEAVHSVARCW